MNLCRMQGEIHREGLFALSRSPATRKKLVDGETADNDFYGAIETHATEHRRSSMQNRNLGYIFFYIITPFSYSVLRRETSTAERQMKTKHVLSAV